VVVEVEQYKLELMGVIKQAQVVMVQEYLLLLVVMVFLVDHLDIMLEVAAEVVQLIDLKRVLQVLVEKVVVQLVVLVKILLPQQLLLILVVAVEALVIYIQTLELMLQDQLVVQELLLLDTNIKINMYLLNLKINI
jgi:hypothetical protein